MMNQTEDREKEKGKDVNQSPIKTLFDKFAHQKDVTFIYVDPISHENQCIVPVAKMNYSFGAGGGKGTNTKEEETSLEQGEGEGGGGLISVKPLGVYEMKHNSVRFKPVIDVKFISIISAALTLGMTLLRRKK